VSDISASGNYAPPVGVQVDHVGTDYRIAEFNRASNDSRFTSRRNDKAVR
jgi:hypothetical protein